MQLLFTFNNKSPANSRLKSGLLDLAIVSAFLIGFYSLYIASANTGQIRPLTEEGLLRTATAKDINKIALALGPLIESDLAYLIIDDRHGSSGYDLEQNAQQAAQNLGDSGLVVRVRCLKPNDPDYATIVQQNMIDFFPAVLVVKEEGGIILVNGNFSSENLEHVYHAVWGKKSDCGAAKNAVY